MNRLMTVAEVAKMLNCSISTIYAWTDTGKIPFCKINGLIRFDAGEIEKFLENSKRSKIIPKLEIKPSIENKQIDSIIENAVASYKKRDYNSPQGKPDPIKPGKEESNNGAL